MDTLTIGKIRQILKNNNLPRTGSRNILIKRLRDNNVNISDYISVPYPPIIYLIDIVTGVPDVDREILLRLDDKLLFSTCRINKYTATLCNENFWNLRIQYIYNSDLSEYKKPNETYRDIYKELIKNGGTVQRELRYAVSRGYLPIIQYLVAQGADINAEGDGLLTWAALGGHLKIVEYLIEKGADIHVNNDDAFITASEGGHLKIAKYLAKQGANIHVNNDEALVLASQNGHLSMVKYLIAQGADMHTQNNKPIRKASEFGKLSIVKYLVEHGADNHDNEVLVLASQNGHLSVVKYLIARGADINRVGEALAEARKNKQTSVVNYLRKVILTS